MQEFQEHSADAEPSLIPRQPREGGTTFPPSVGSPSPPLNPSPPLLFPSSSCLPFYPHLPFFLICSSSYIPPSSSSSLFVFCFHLPPLPPPLPLVLFLPHLPLLPAPLAHSPLTSSFFSIFLHLPPSLPPTALSLLLFVHPSCLFCLPPPSFLRPFTSHGVSTPPSPPLPGLQPPCLAPLLYLSLLAHTHTPIVPEQISF